MQNLISFERINNNNYNAEDFNIREIEISNIYKKILEIDTEWLLILKWGTSLSMFFDSNRFSEDLDFDIIDTNKAIEMWQKIYEWLNNDWYNVNIYFDWNNVVHLDIKYILKSWNEYICQVDIFKDDYWLSNQYRIHNFDAFNAKILKLSSNFAHKCCAYLERWDKKIEMSWKPKWRDIYDIWWYLKQEVKPSIDVIEARTDYDNETDFTFTVLKQLIIKHKNRHDAFIHEIENFAYDNTLRWRNVIHEVVVMINEQYFDNNFLFNIDVFKEIENNENFIKINKHFVILQQDACYKVFVHTNLNDEIYSTKDKNKLYSYLSDNFKQLSLLKN